MSGGIILEKQFAFELLELWPAAIAAGYTSDDVQRCVAYSGPTFDEENFYYCAYFGNPLLASVKSSILVCRKKSDRSFVYAVNCQDFSIDTGNTYLGPPRMICRSAPVIKDNKLYLASSWVTNIGPQLFCINKNTGTLIYAIAYNLPYETSPPDQSRSLAQRNKLANLPMSIGKPNCFFTSCKNGSNHNGLLCTRSSVILPSRIFSCSSNRFQS